MTFEDMFQEIKQLFLEADVSGIEEHLAFQFVVTGEAEGIFYAEVRDGELFVEPYEYYDRDVIFQAAAKVLLGIAKGKVNPVVAYTTGKLKIEGSIDKALMLQKFVESK